MVARIGCLERGDLEAVPSGPAVSFSFAQALRAWPPSYGPSGTGNRAPVCPGTHRGYPALLSVLGFE
jgi:hypothetical protein